jgi:co-chaperonin GroES (HSP10)
MNYKRIYDSLINRGQHREYDGYTEIHHIVPRCLGGSDDQLNLVRLTPEEHYLAHQLLTRIHPQNSKLVYAAVMMCPNRPTNKMYGWLKRRLSAIQTEKFLNGGSPTQDLRWISNEHETVLVDKFEAEQKISSGLYIAGKIAKKLKCGHMVAHRCIVCDDLKRKAYDKKKEDTKILAHQLFEEFKTSDCKSVCEFAKIKNTSQPRLSMLWKKYVDEYKNNRQHGKSFLKA